MKNKELYKPFDLRSVEKSQTLLLNEQSRNLENSGREVFKFGFGQSPFPPLARAIAALQQNAQRKDYSPVQGILPLRERIAEFHKNAEGIDVDASRVLVAPGSKILIYAAMAAFKKADILIPAPSWVSYRPQAALLNHAAISVETTAQKRWRITPEAIEKAVRQKTDAKSPSVLILNYPGNPDGLSYSAAELRALAESFRKHNILVISDEIYGLLNHQGTHRSVALDYPEGTIVTGGLSKWCGAGGWRLGIALLPKALDGEYKETLLGIASETYSCASLPVQYAACEAYLWDSVTQDYLAHQRRILALTGNWASSQLQNTGMVAHAPEGGFYLFLDFSPLAESFKHQGISTSNQLCERLLADTGIALLPGDAFGMESSHLSARLAYVEFDGVAALAASEKLGLQNKLDETFLRQHLAKTVRGIEQLCRWTQDIADSNSFNKITARAV